jgi:hypothetical protein
MQYVHLRYFFMYAKKSIRIYVFSCETETNDMLCEFYVLVGKLDANVKKDNNENVLVMLKTKLAMFRDMCKSDKKIQLTIELVVP